jgi:hypothetical protein
MSASAKQIGMIKATVRRAGLNIEQASMVLRNTAGVESTTQLDNVGVEDVMAVLEELLEEQGQECHYSGPRYWRSRSDRRFVSSRMVHRIEQLAANVDYDLGGLCERFSRSGQFPAGRTRAVRKLTGLEAWRLAEMLASKVRAR